MRTRRKILPYDPKLKERARKLRQKMTLAEIMLWNELKGKQMMGFDFDRQRPIDKYIVDFYCKDLMLAIELDGESHVGKEDYDTKRQKRLESLGVRLLRFEDLEVRQNLEKVIDTIHQWIEKNAPQHPDEPLPGRIPTKNSPPGRGLRGGSKQ